MINLYNGDCLEVMKEIPTGSVDMILCDLPYGTTYASWDSVIPSKQLWASYKRLIKKNGAIVLFGVQPFSSYLITSNPEMFKYQWVWNKVNGSNFANANRQPLKCHEDILVFYEGQCLYNPQKTVGKPNHVQGSSKKNVSETRLISDRVGDDLSGLKHPKSIQTFSKHSSQCGLHPTQKPVDLCEYLIKTYTNEGEWVLDNTMGSGTTGVACVNTSRNFIGIEKDEKYFEIAKERINGVALSGHKATK